MFLPPDELAKLYSPLDIPESGEQPFTDYSRWRLRVNDGGRHTWHYLRTDEEDEKWPQNKVDKYWLGLPLVCAPVPFAVSTHCVGRTSLLFRKRTTPLRLPGTGTNFTNIFSQKTDIGPASMVVQCSCSPAWSLGHTLREWDLQSRSVSK